MRAAVDRGGEQLRQAGRDRLDERLLAHEMDVGLDREFRRRQRAFLAHHVVAVEAETVGEDEPALDAALVLAEAVVVGDAMEPFAAEVAVVAAAHEGSVLQRDRRLIAVAVQRPRLHLPLVQLAAVQETVERVQIVVALGPDRAQRRLEPFGAQRLGQDRLVHGRTSIPS